MISVGIFASVEICAEVNAGQGISMEMFALMPLGSMRAACSGKKPDSECPINAAPFNWTASAAMPFQVGFGLGSVALRSGIICLYSSSAASTGNCSSANGLLKLGPKRKMDQAV